MNQITANWIEKSCNGKTVLLSGGLRNLEPLHRAIISNLSRIESIRFIKAKADTILASNLMVGTHKSIITKPEHPKALGVWIEFDFRNKLLEFAEITSFKKGNGQKMVGAVLTALLASAGISKSTFTIWSVSFCRCRSEFYFLP